MIFERIVGIDIDGVTADLLGRWLTIYNEEYDDNLRHADVTDYDLNTIVKPAARNRIYDIVARSDIYDGVLPMTGASDAIHMLKDAGWEVIFISHCFRTTYDQKMEWLARFGFIDYAWENGTRPNKSFIAARDKLMINVPILIDDHLPTITRFTGSGRRGMLFHSDRHPQGLTWPEVTGALIGR